MTVSDSTILEWFDQYFNDIYHCQGSLDTVPKLKKYFSPDLEFVLYTPIPPLRFKTMDRDALLMSFVHPGLIEEISPQDYIIDISRMIVVVQFKIVFEDTPSGKKWDPIQASAHYHLVADENHNLRIRQIKYWTQQLPEEVFVYWGKYREEALTELAMRFINKK